MSGVRIEAGHIRIQRQPVMQARLKQVEIDITAPRQHFNHKCAGIGGPIFTCTHKR
jgi:hypothetical protein